MRSDLSARSLRHRWTQTALERRRRVERKAGRSLRRSSARPLSRPFALMLWPTGRGDAAETDAPRASARNRSSACAPGPASRIGESSATHDMKTAGRKARSAKATSPTPRSAKMKTAHGVIIQGYTAVAAVDGKHQVIMACTGPRRGQEHGLLVPTVEGLRENLNALGGAGRSADEGHPHRRCRLRQRSVNMRYVFDAGIDACHRRHPV